MLISWLFYTGKKSCWHKQLVCFRRWFGFFSTFCGTRRQELNTIHKNIRAASIYLVKIFIIIFYFLFFFTNFRFRLICLMYEKAPFRFKCWWTSKLGKYSLIHVWEKWKKYVHILFMKWGMDRYLEKFLSGYRCKSQQAYGSAMNQWLRSTLIIVLHAFQKWIQVLKFCRRILLRNVMDISLFESNAFEILHNIHNVSNNPRIWA